MGRVCKVCTHPQRAAIEKEVLANAPLRTIAVRWGVAHTSIARHKVHIPAALEKAELSLSQRLERMVYKALAKVDTLMDDESKGVSVAAINSLSRYLSIFADRMPKGEQNERSTAWTVYLQEHQEARTRYLKWYTDDYLQRPAV